MSEIVGMQWVLDAPDSAIRTLERTLILIRAKDSEIRNLKSEMNAKKEELKGGYPIIFASNVFHNSHLIQKCIQNQQLLLILYTLLNQMRVVKNIRRKDDRINSL